MANSFNVKVGAKVDTKQMDAQLDGYHKTIVVQTKMSDGGYKEITTFKNGIDSTAKAIEKFDSSGKSMGATIKTISTDTSVASTAIGRLGQDFLDTTGKVLKFGAATAAIALFTQGISQAVKAMADYDEQLTNFKKVSDLSGQALDDYADKLDNLGKSVYRSRTEMLEGATSFKQAGYSDDDAARLAQIAALYQNVADSEISASEASDYIIASMKAFNISAENAQEIIDKTNEVDLYLPLNNYIG